MLGSAERRQLDELGCLVLPGFIAPPMLAELRERGHWVFNSVWMLDDFTPDNGAARMIPRSSRARRHQGGHGDSSIVGVMP